MLNKQQQKDAAECEKSGGTQDCLGCSCSVCLAQVNPCQGMVNKKELLEQFMEEFTDLKDGVPAACTSIEEMFGAYDMLKHITGLVEKRLGDGSVCKSNF